MNPTAGHSTGTGIAVPSLHELCTVYFCALVSVVDPVVTVTNPSVAPVGTVAVSTPGSGSVEIAVTPLNFTTDEELNPSPRIPTFDPTFPLVLCSVTNALSP